MFYWLLKRIFLGPILFAVFRPWVKGEHHVPEAGGAILASNHLSFSDSIFLPLVVPRRVTFLAKADYFTGHGIKGRLKAAFFTLSGQLPIDRSGGSASEGALTTGLRVLRRGDLLGIYPEGTRSLDGKLYRGKTGVARMALEAGVPVLPVAMIGTDKVQPIGRKIPHLGRVGIVIGEPLDFSRYEGMQDDRFVLRSITDEIMYALMELSGQEYVDVYASTMKERLAAARRSKPSSVVSAASAMAEKVSERVERVSEKVERVKGATSGESTPGAPDAPATTDSLDSLDALGTPDAPAAADSGASDGEPPVERSA
ncbi:MAG: 1-acyl-sn-glycerol-3-phosphate acyltransferase [Kineosporiaceae bacterium]|nr:1-acyl-sn-glycerol-3-phosphate acyltransferase [Kineosporiaceae bacterium]MBK8077090.1 1-acyl-sn-glycerol-3-phosphate acyltransferase [Kineosporiaceae bacterium]